MPKISVIVPAYNCARHLSETLSSVLNQTYQNFEIIVIDDGSTDTTRAVVNEYIRKYPQKIKYFYQNNRGPGAARNKGIREAQSEYVTFLDADDILLSESLLKRCLFLDKYPQVSLIFSDYVLKDEENQNEMPRLKEKRFLDFFKDNICSQQNLEIIFNGNLFYKYLSFTPFPIWTGTVMARKEIFKEIGFFREDIRIGEDTDFWLKVIKEFQVGFIDEPLSYYYHYRSSLSKQAERYYLDNIRLYKNLYRETKGRNRLIRAKLSEYHYGLAYYYRNQAFFKKAFLHLLKSVFYSPQNINIYKTCLFLFFPHRLKNKIKDTLNINS